MLIQQNIDAISDFGFGDKETRKLYREWAVSLGAKISLHYLDVSSKIRRERVHKRNNEKEVTFVFEVSDEMFDYVDTMFVPPTEEELIDGIVIQKF